MPAKMFLDQIRVKNPCTQSWDSMVGTDQFRFCEHCNLSVYNLAEMTRKDVERLIAQSHGRLCVRYQRRPDGSLNTLPASQKLHRIGRRASQVAASAFSASLAVTGAAIPQGTSVVMAATPITATEPNRIGLIGGAVVGVVKDQNGAVVTSASIGLTNNQTQIGLFSSVSMSGEFRFEALTAGIYSLRIEAPGFAAVESGGIYVQDGSETRLDQVLELASIEATVEASGEREQFISFGGAVAFVAPSDPFIRAAQQDDLPEVTKLIAGRDVNVRDKASNTTALEHAVRNSNREMVQLLLGAGAKVDLRNPSGETVLMMLDSDATSDLTWDLINAGAKVSLRDSDGETPLMAAARFNNVDVVKTLIEAGADVNARDEAKQTALMNAASQGLINVLRTLILAGADLNAVDAEGRNALSFAMEGDHGPTIRLLRSQGATEIARKLEKEN